MVRCFALVACVVTGAACGARPPTVKPPAPVGDDITLFRDAAVIRQRVVLRVPAAPTTVTVKTAAGVAADEVIVLDRGGLSIAALHGKTDPPAGADPGDAQAQAPERATELRLDVQAPRAGQYAIVIGYITDRLPWNVAYSLTTTPERDRGVLRGALAIRNNTGLALRAANARLIDAELGAWRARTAEQLARALAGGTPPPAVPTTARELGPLVLGSGETRVELVPASLRSMSSVLVYDPIGPKLDNPGAAPLRDARLGVDVPPSTRVRESFEVTRDRAASVGLPAGPVRLLERRANASLVVLGESRLFEASARDAELDTIAVGTADGVTGTRERRELTVDDENRRIVEEFVITLDNGRAHPASVLVREHLYRGQNWTLAYHSASAAAKEGAQQIALRAEVPARSQVKILYVVVYTWGR